MTKFTDANGIGWTVDVKASTVYRFESTTGKDLFAAAFNGRLVTSTAWELAFFACETQIKARGFRTVEDVIRDMRKALADDEPVPVGFDALAVAMGEWLDGLGRAGLPRLTLAVTDELSAFFPDAKEGDDDAPFAGDRGPGKTSTDSPQPPASNPGDTRSGNSQSEPSELKGPSGPESPGSAPVSKS